MGSSKWWRARPWVLLCAQKKVCNLWENVFSANNTVVCIKFSFDRNRNLQTIFHRAHVRVSVCIATIFLHAIRLPVVVGWWRRWWWWRWWQCGVVLMWWQCVGRHTFIFIMKREIEKSILNFTHESFQHFFFTIATSHFVWELKILDINTIIWESFGAQVNKNKK